MYQKWKTLWIASIGSTLELYDFSLYAVMIQVLALKFFPQTDPIIALLSSLAAFTSGFLIRPITAILWGYLGDRFGRRYALSYTMLAMAIPTFIIGLLPTYDQIGIAAPIALIICRILQGASMSGEFNGAMIFMLEHAAEGQKGKISGIMNAINTGGVILATCFGLIVSSPGMPDWAWRVPFLFGALVGAFGFIVRSKLEETPEYNKLLSQRRLVSNPLKDALSLKAQAFMTFSQAALNGVVTYTMISFMSIYLSYHLCLPTSWVLASSLLLLISSAIGELLLGRLTDTIGINRVIRSSIWTMVIAAIPAFFLITTKVLPLVIIGILLCGAFLASIAISTHTFIQDLFPAKSRYSGITFCYNLGMSIVGGTTPLLLTWTMEKTGYLLTPGYILILSAIIYKIIFELYMCKTHEYQSPARRAF